MRPGGMIKLTDEKLSNIVTDYHFSGEQNRNILVKSAVEAQLKRVVEWDKGVCPHPRHRDDLPLNGRKDCHKCWQSLLEEGKE